ncbi:hypothetical protein [Streptomyces sp. OE57]|uniref:hypothetical protein n=1 Tax=Streptomyces lacaronensis TaxID=3379885 RepID=UPI0039B77D4D
MVPGDYVHPGASGAVVIPGGSPRRVIDEALKAEAEDARIAEGILGGYRTPA